MGDNADLQALFEQASAQAQAQAKEQMVTDAMQKPILVEAPAPTEDDLELLFDQVSSQTWSNPAPEASATTTAQGAAVAEAVSGADVDTAKVEGSKDVFRRIGHLTRTVHDALRELGYDKAVESALHALPDTRDRLAYIAALTGKAADRALAAVEAGKIHQDRLRERAAKLAMQWDRIYAGDADVEEFKSTAGDTREFLDILPVETGATSAQLTEIMMAQDFHDLTGQVINGVVGIARDMEQHLLGLLLELSAEGKRPSIDEEGLNGPVINPLGRASVVTNQAQVDDLLESLGF